MKTTIALIITTTLLSITTPSFGKDEGWKEKCTAAGELAHEIMTARQAGVAMPTIMGIMDGKKIHEDMVVEAYDSPRYGDTGKYAEKAADDFRDQWYLRCYKVLALGGTK